jgi:restriction system protein
MQKADVLASPPTFAELGTAVRILDGEAVRHVRDLMNTLFDHAGAAAPSHDWSDPDRWIDERLTGELRALAHKVWSRSGKTINPRFLYDHSTFISRLRLLEPVGGIYRLGERGRRFLAADDAILREFVALRSTKRGRARRNLVDALAKHSKGKPASS